MRVYWAMAKFGTGRTRLDRLVHIGVCSSFLGVEALKLAVREAKTGKDVRRYLEAQTHLETIGPGEPEAVRDKSWIDRTDKQNQAEAKRLEEELKGYKNNLVKESIRVRLAVKQHGYKSLIYADGK
jgi:COP9 signalosome complex subunit 1